MVITDYVVLDIATNISERTQQNILHDVCEFFYPELLATNLLSEADEMIERLRNATLPVGSYPLQLYKL